MAVWLAPPPIQEVTQQECRYDLENARKFPIECEDDRKDQDEHAEYDSVVGNQWGHWGKGTISAFAKTVLLNARKKNERTDLKTRSKNNSLRVYYPLQ